MSTPDVKLQAVLRSACPPSEEQRSRLTAFLEKKYQQSVELSWSEDKSILGGFRIELGTEVIDWIGVHPTANGGYSWTMWLSISDAQQN